MEMFFEVSFWNALWQVILIDIVLAGDNAIVVGLAAAGVAAHQRAKVIFWGILAAVGLRIIFALATTQLLAIVGLMLAGGILLLWVCWKMWRELRASREEEALGAEMVAEGMSPDGVNPRAEGAPADGGKTMGQAIRQIIIADVSMSLDNVLAVAGAAQEHPEVLILGLALSVAFMGAAATAIAKLLNRFHWIAYIGLAVIFYVALDMIWRGSQEVAPLIGLTL